MSDQHLRISDAEREQAAAALAEHYVQGRLTTEEHSDRLDQIWAARTRAEVAPVFRDLPGRFAPPPFPQPPRQPFPPAFRGYAAAPPRRSKGMPAPLMAILVILVIATVLSHLPLILFGLLVWWILAKHHRVGSHHRMGSRRRW